MAQREISSRRPATVFLVYGADDYLVTEAARRILDALCPEAERAFGLDEVNGDAATGDEAGNCLRQCLVAVRTVGFFQGRKVVWFRNASFLKRADILRVKAVQTWMTELTALVRSGLPEGHRLLVTAPGVDGRSAFFKACREAGDIQVYDLPQKAYQARAAARDRARSLFQGAGLRIGEAALSHFLDRAGEETRQMASEVEKLALHLGKRRDVDTSAVREIVSVSRTSEGWDLAEAVGSGRTAEALALVRQLLFQKVPWVVLVGGLESRFRELLVMHEAMARGWLRREGKVGVWTESPDADAVLGGLGAGESRRDPRSWHPYRVGLLMEQAARFSLAGIEARRRLILDAREQMVSGFAEPEILLEFLVLRLGGRVPSRRRAVGGQQVEKVI